MSCGNCHNGTELMEAVMLEMNKTTEMKNCQSLGRTDMKEQITGNIGHLKSMKLRLGKKGCETEIT